MLDDVRIELSRNWILSKCASNLRVPLFPRALCIASRRDSINITNVRVYNSPRGNRARSRALRATFLSPTKLDAVHRSRLFRLCDFARYGSFAFTICQI